MILFSIGLATKNPAKNVMKITKIISSQFNTKSNFVFHPMKLSSAVRLFNGQVPDFVLCGVDKRYFFCLASISGNCFLYASKSQVIS